MYTHSMANENDMEWFTPGKSCKKCDTKPFSRLCLWAATFLWICVFPLIRESISEAIKRKLSNRDYKMEKMRGHVISHDDMPHGCVVQMMFISWNFSNM
jgi:hypothetical protein